MSDSRSEENHKASEVAEERLPIHRRVLRFIGRVIRAYGRDDVPLLSAAIAFYAVLSIAPILVLALALADAVAAGDAVRSDIMRWVGERMGADVATLINDWITHFRSANDSKVAVYVSFVVLMVSSTRLFQHVRSALDRIWHIKEAPQGTFLGSLLTRLIGLGIVGMLGLVLLSSVGAKVVIRMLITRFELGRLPRVWFVFDWGVYILLVGGLVYFMYRRLPSALVQRKHARRGAAVTAVALVLGGEVTSHYLARPGVVSGFGAAGSTMALVLWVYYATQVFLIGAIVTWLFAQKDAKLRKRGFRKRRRRKKAVPNGGASTAAPSADASQDVLDDEPVTNEIEELSPADALLMDNLRPVAARTFAWDRISLESIPPDSVLADSKPSGGSSSGDSSPGGNPPGNAER